MAKYIDIEKLIHDLEERIYAYSEGYADGDNYRKDAIETLLKDVRYQNSLRQEQLSTSLCGRVSNDGEYPPGLILGSEQLHSCLKRFPDDTYVDIFIIAKEDK